MYTRTHLQTQLYSAKEKQQEKIQKDQKSLSLSFENISRFSSLKVDI